MGGRAAAHAAALRRAARVQVRAARGRTRTTAAASRKASFAIKGDGAYSVFKFEGGTHRVQRVPETESPGRIHTSTATVAVMPEAEDVDVEIDESDLKIDVYRSSGPGGQSVNTTDSAVRITHLPTGIVVAMQDERSQLQNREKAMRVLRARIYEAERERQAAEQAAARSAQVGTGARAEKIRTYNFPENRVTDHRIKLTTHRLDQVLQGDLDEYTDALTAEEQRRALERLTLAEVLRAGDRVPRGARRRHAARRRRAAARARARSDAHRALHAARPAADRGRTRRGARARPAPRPARAARLRARRLGLPPAHAQDGRARARAAAGDGDRRRALPRAARRTSTRRASSTSARAAGRSRSRSKQERPDARRDRDRQLGRTRSRSRARTPRRTVSTCELVEGDLLAGLDGPFDLVVSNPPYVGAAELEALEPEVRDWEPRAALVDEGQTARLAARRARRARRLARARGARGPARPLSPTLLASLGLRRRLAIRLDLAGRERVVEAQWAATRASSGR